MKIVFFELGDWEQDFFKAKLKEHDVAFSDATLSSKNVADYADADAIGVFIYSTVNKQILDKLPNVKFITTLSTGYDHIDIKECKKRKITVCNVPQYGANTVAEHTFALLLALSRKIYKTIRRTRRGNFSIDGLRGFDLKNKSLGVIGTGSIGKHVIRIANGFQMKIMAYDPYKDEKFANKYNVTYTTIPNLLKNADIVSLHCPYNKKTHHLINKKNIKTMKKNAIIINTSRGKLIDTDALLSALDKNIIAGAGLDVLEEECMIKEDRQVLSKQFPKKCDLKIILENHLLMERDNVLVTPHNAFNSHEALQRILDTTLYNIESIKKPINKVT